MGGGRCQALFLPLFFFFFFFRATLQPLEVLRLGIALELHLPASELHLRLMLQLTAASDP